MLWLKSFHILFVMAWMVGIFYLPRIFVHYAEGRREGQDVGRLLIMANRLLVFMTVMAVPALVTGLWLLGYGFSGGWVHAKVTLVLSLMSYHIACFFLLQRLPGEALIHRTLTLRLFNEGALLLVLPIILLVVLKPF